MRKGPGTKGRSGMGRLGVDTAHYLARVSSDGVMANIPQTALQRHLGRRLCSRHPTPISISFLPTHELSVLIELRAVANFERYPQSPDTAQITGHPPHLLTTPSPAKIRPTFLSPSSASPARRSFYSHLPSHCLWMSTFAVAFIACKCALQICLSSYLSTLTLHFHKGKDHVNYDNCCLSGT